jgi:predicted P-loop ATPase
MSGVARTHKPGCQCDYTLIVEGHQGIGKSQALRALLPETGWVASLSCDLHTDNAIRLIQEPCIVVFDELDSLNKKEAEAIKAFTTECEDSLIDKYQRFRTTLPRRCIFAGTTNKTDWNRDSTGARRFWPVWCDYADREGIARERDQLWAEALHRYREGEPWWLDDPSLESAATLAQKERRDADDWHNTIEAFAEEKDRVLPEEIYAELGIETGRQSRLDGRRVADIMRELGFKRQSVRLGRKSTLCEKPKKSDTPHKLPCDDDKLCDDCKKSRKGYHRMEGSA